MILLVGKTCSGKSSVANVLRDTYNYKKVVTYTTRPPREGEVNGVEYNFISAEEFERLKGADFFFETTSYNVASGQTWYYGTAKKSLVNNAVIVMNPEGMKKMKNLLNPDEFKLDVIYLNVTEGTAWNRLRLRGDSSDEAQRRIKADKEDFSNIEEYYDISITTDDLDPKEIARLIVLYILNFRKAGEEL